jgi:hypothetical protein
LQAIAVEQQLLDFVPVDSIVEAQREPAVVMHVRSRVVAPIRQQQRPRVRIRPERDARAAVIDREDGENLLAGAKPGIAEVDGLVGLG